MTSALFASKAGVPVALLLLACNRLRISAVVAENWGKFGVPSPDAGKVVVRATQGAACEGVGVLGCKGGGCCCCCAVEVLLPEGAAGLGLGLGLRCAVLMGFGGPLVLGFSSGGRFAGSIGTRGGYSGENSTERLSCRFALGRDGVETPFVMRCRSLSPYGCLACVFAYRGQLYLPTVH